LARNEVLFEVSSMFRALLKQFSQEWNKRGYMLSLPQYKMLYLLNKEGPQKVSQLAMALGNTPAAVTGLADKLFAEGHIQRERAESDRRVVYVSITEKGRHMLDEVKETQEEIFQTFFDKLPDEDIHHLKRIFSQLLANMDDKP